ncbi:hypothetical protein BJ508DRAFT_356864 [Ascobolus immersus RN42]|uniref:Uncharacterized protein n=1 Tax=Ascobolus immersus RN42 TaxID=1160509 RepID=A0A3N4J2J2_ASCIM|nr:hypothetical protein BJ508DRAFT_356864 [Ascobolus immersus RN42]
MDNPKDETSSINRTQSISTENVRNKGEKDMWWTPLGNDEDYKRHYESLPLEMLDPRITNLDEFRSGLRGTAAYKNLLRHLKNGFNLYYMTEHRIILVPFDTNDVFDPMEVDLVRIFDALNRFVEECRVGLPFDPTHSSCGPNGGVNSERTGRRLSSTIYSPLSSMLASSHMEPTDLILLILWNSSIDLEGWLNYTEQSHDSEWAGQLNALEKICTERKGQVLFVSSTDPNLIAVYVGISRRAHAEASQCYLLSTRRKLRYKLMKQRECGRDMAAAVRPALGVFQRLEKIRGTLPYSGDGWDERMGQSFSEGKLVIRDACVIFAEELEFPLVHYINFNSTSREEKERLRREYDESLFTSWHPNGEYSFEERFRRGLVSAEQMNLIILMLKRWERSFEAWWRLMEEDDVSWPKVALRSQLESYELFSFAYTLRCESVEARLWRHLNSHEEDMWWKTDP